MLFSFSFEFFAAHKYSLLIHDLFSRMVVTRLLGNFFRGVGVDKGKNEMVSF